jgi:hypothetical protein
VSGKDAVFISHHVIIWKAPLQLFANRSKKNHGDLSRFRDTSSLLGLAKLVSALSEDLVEVVLEPPDIRVEAGELPHAVDLLVPVGVVAVSVALDGDVCAGLVAVLLVGHAELVVADDLVVRDLLPLGAADEVLGHEGGVAEDLGVRGHLDELVCGHGLPDLVEERAVVDAEGRGNALGQACPVLGVVGAGPLVNGGHAALHLWRGGLACGLGCH